MTAANTDSAPFFTPPADAEGSGSEKLRGEHWSITTFSFETGRTRETVTKRIQKNGVRPSGTGRAGHALYPCRDVLPLLYSGTDEGGVDPDKLSPTDRKAHFGAEEAKVRLAQKMGELIPRDEHDAEKSRCFSIIAQGLDTIPDVLERDCGLSAKQLEAVETSLDSIRNELVDRLGSPFDAAPADAIKGLFS